MELRLIHADSAFHELGEVTEYEQFDGVVTLSSTDEDNDWMLELPPQIWRRRPILTGHYIYISGTEWGGPVERVRHSTADGCVRVYGTGWRGLLARRIVCPPSGSTHLTIAAQEANAAIAALLGSWQSNLLSVGNGSSGLTCSASIRYRTLLEAVNDMLETAGGRLCVCFAGGQVELCARPVRDRSAEIELSQEYEARIISSSSAGVYNHILALGRGELLERTVLELWRLPDGTITQDGTAPGVPDGDALCTLLYDYSSVESEAELLSATRRRLTEAAAVSGMEIELYGSNDTLELTDIVSVRDQITGMTAQLRVAEKNLNISSTGVTVKLILK